MHQLYTFLWLILILTVVYYLPAFKADGLRKRELTLAMLVKFLAGAIYIFIYSGIYGTDKGELNYDASDFLYESHQLNLLFYKSPLTYFKLMLEIDDHSTLVQNYIKHTIHWSRGNLILINDAKNLVKIHSLIQFVSFNNIYVHFILFNLISLIGLRQLYLATKQFVRFNHRIYFWLCLLLPSSLFWGSTVLKEPLLILGMGFLLRSLLDAEIPRWKKFLYGLLSIILLIGFKPYILICFLIGFIFYWFASYFFRGKIILAMLAFGLLLFSSTIVFSGLRRKVVHFVSGKQFDFENIGQGGIYFFNEEHQKTFYFPTSSMKNLEIHDGYFYIRKPAIAYKYRLGYREKIERFRLKPDQIKHTITFEIPGSDSYIETTMIFSSFSQMLYNIPEALGNALFRPFFGDPGKNLKYFALAETFLLFGFLILALFNRRKLEDHERLFLATCFIFTICLALIVGWTTPVLGAIVRYRMPAYWVILIMAFVVIKPTLKWKTKKNIS